MGSMLSSITRIKLSFKIVGSFLCITVIVMASNIYALKSMKSIEDSASSMYNKNLVLIKDLANMSESIHQLNASISSYLLVKDQKAREAERERISATKSDLSVLLLKLQQAELTRQEQTKMKLFGGLWNSYYSLMDQILSLADQNDLNYAISLYEKEMLKRAKDIKGIFQDVTSINQQEADTRYQDSVQLYNKVLTTMWIIAILSLIINAAIGWLMQRSVLNPVRELLRGFKNVEQGDLTMPLRLNRRDEFGELGDGFNRMRESIAAIVIGNKELVGSLAAISEKIAGHAQKSGMTSKKISVGLQNTVQHSERQISSLSKDFIMIREITEGLRQMAISIDEISHHSSEMETNSKHSQTAIRETIDKMNELQQKTVRTESVIHKLGTQTSEISGIAKTIENIAKATDILSLNAGIESARAGAAGKGFGIIAQEVRKLADNSRKETQVISEVVEFIRQDTEELLQSGHDLGVDMQISREKVDNLFAKLKQMDVWIHDVNDRIQDLTATIEEIAAGSEEINLSIKRMEDAFLNLHHVTTEYSVKSDEQVSLMDEVNFSVGELNRISGLLDDAVNRFVTV